MKTIVRIDRPDYVEPLYYDLDEEYIDIMDMLYDGISRGYPQMITSKDEEE